MKLGFICLVRIRRALKLRPSFAQFLAGEFPGARDLLGNCRVHLPDARCATAGPARHDERHVGNRWRAFSGDASGLWTANRRIGFPLHTQRGWVLAPFRLSRRFCLVRRWLPQAPARNGDDRHKPSPSRLAWTTERPPGGLERKASLPLAGEPFVAPSTPLEIKNDWTWTQS